MYMIIAMFYSFLSSRKKGQSEDSNPDFCDASTVLYQLTSQANWDQVIMWVNHNTVDVR